MMVVPILLLSISILLAMPAFADDDAPASAPSLVAAAPSFPTGSAASLFSILAALVGFVILG